MDIKKLQTLVVDALEDVKGQDITVFDTVHLTSLFDRIAVVSGTSNRQTKALAASVRDKVKAAGGDVIGIEGEDTGEWVLVDLGDMIVHIMQPAIRQYYRLEEIWGDKPVKLGAAKRKGTVEAAEAAEAKPKSKHLASTQEAPEVKPVNERKPAAKKAAAAKTPAAAKKAPAKKAASKAVGKVVKVAATKTEEAAVKALKALPPKRAAAVKAPKAPADAVPVKKVIKRVAKKDAE
ncbi:MULTISPECIES: ribosome silencing factor [Massilia]|uniref:Ribosomal silencing factor RsfS n=1 Tax=Massilia violaceinigra TaxID=2045208 RepID=A0A2D2DKA0_9BURK|nr:MULTISPECIES: ribosome silencing factor [Massilia]ATQ75406.1 ribosome silencing factor [Massilia violaceinigra]MDQ1813911.1 ribosome silencing factor [Massilia sp. CCM 9210]MDQ1829500.1 ribosome silencing factor [Massilia sp. CCM 9029]MDQ1924487.1 ribosome silencing factor [Massilia sp. CCM 9206]